MRFVVLATFFTAAMAVPTGTGGGSGSYKPCPNGLYSVPQCCATDALGVAVLNCQSPKVQPKNAKNFQATCAKNGQQDKCCVLPVLGQALLCVDPVA